MSEEERIPSFRESAENTSEIIAESPILKALLNAIPYVGGSLSELLAGKGSQIMEERRDELLRRLSEHMEALDERAVRKDYFESPEGFDLLLKALESATKTRSKEKTDLYARILAGATRIDQGGFSSVEEYLHLIADLTPKEVEVARWMFERGPTISEEQQGNWTLKAARDCGIGQNDLSMILNRLEARGLVNRVTAGRDDKGVWIDTDIPISTYDITKAFEQLMELINLDVY